MFDQKKAQEKSLEINQYKNILDNSSSPYSKNKSNQNGDSSKENCDSNRQYLISDNSQSAINPLTKSHEDLITSNSNIKTNNLFSAVEYNDLEKMQELLKQDKSKINDLNEEGLSLLHIAVIKANIKMINLLLKFGADSNILSDKKKQTPLHLAYLNQNSMTEEIIKELLKNKANENIFDSKNKKPSDYMRSSYKKNKTKIDHNIDYTISNSDKKSYTNNNTGNTVTVVTIENHLDSFLTTNKEEENKSNINNINTNSNNNTIVQSPAKLDVDYDLNEIISINNSCEKSNSHLNQKMNNKLNTSEENDKNKDKETKRRQYTFGKEDDFMKFQNKNNEKNNEENKNNITKNSTFDNLDINNNFYFENLKNDENKIAEKNAMNNSIKEEDYDKTIKDNEILNDSLEEKNEINENEEEEKEERDNCEQLYDSLKNNNILLNKDKDNINSQNSFNLNNNSLTYTDSLNVNGSIFQSKNKITNINFTKSGSNNNTNENEENENEKKINVKPPSSDNKIYIDIKKSKDDEKIEFNDDMLAQIITKKRNSFSHSSKNKSNAYRNTIINKTTRNSAYNKTAFNFENENFNNSMRSNRTNYLSPSYINNRMTGENDSTINSNSHKQKKRDSYNNMIYQNNSYKNNITIVHNGTDSRFGISGNLTQYSTQSQNKKKNLFSTDKIKVIMNDNYPNQNNKITEFNYLDNKNENPNIYKNESYINNNNINNNNDNDINLSYLKYWLSNLGLLDYLNSFIQCEAYDINILVERMKSYQTKLRFEDLESSLKIRIPGYNYRILCKLEADAGLIDPKIVKFMIREGMSNESNKNNMMRSINNKSDKNMNISLSQSSYYQCFNCCKMNQIKKHKKNDLKYFLLRYNLIHLYQNFAHNGFDMIEYVIIQMYSSFPINEDILENCFHIYDEKQRIITLKAIVAEMKKINKFLSSEEYNNCDKNLIKYDNVFFEDDSNKDKSKIAMKNNNDNLLNNCHIF